MPKDTHWIRDPAATSFVFGPFRLFPTERLLTEANKPIALGSRAFDVLLALLERPGELVTKDELMARVWPNTFVGPATLAVHISALRRALRDRRGGNRYVINIPGRGYRFVARVTFEEDLPHVETAAPLPVLPAHVMEPRARAEIIELAQELRRRPLLGLPVHRRNGTGSLCPVCRRELISIHEDGVG